MGNFSTPTTTPLQNSGGGSPQPPSHRERDETYWGVIVALSDRWRVIICKDEIQFILQKRSVPSPNTGTWAGKSYSTTRSGLIAACSDRELLAEASARQALDALPSRIGSKHEQRVGPHSPTQIDSASDELRLTAGNSLLEG